MKKPKNKMNFKMLESISNSQRDIRDWLLLYCAKKTAGKRAKREDKIRRKSQFENLKESIMPEFSYSNDTLAFQQMVKLWQDDEKKWSKKHSNKYSKTDIINSLSYRLQTMFFKNHTRCPFYTEDRKGKKTDEKNFQKENQKLFKKFLNQSIKSAVSSKKIHLFKEMKRIDISKSIDSAAHKLHGKDLDIAKGFLIGGVTGGAASVFLGPVIGGYIGNLAGFSGAAATSYGLAFLGGGSLASGGLGMAGGSAVLGLGFGISNGVRKGIKSASIDKINILQAQSLLPLLLAIGRIQFKNGDEAIPDLIHRVISKRLEEFEQRLEEHKNKYDKIFHSKKKAQNLEKTIKQVKKIIKLYRKAKDMSRYYDWQSGYDIWKSLF